LPWRLLWLCSAICRTRTWLKPSSSAMASVIAAAYRRLIMSSTKGWKSRSARLGEKFKFTEAVISGLGTVVLTARWNLHVWW
jgi:hypothetical protein